MYTFSSPVCPGELVFVPWFFGDQSGVSSCVVMGIEFLPDPELNCFYIDLKSDDPAFDNFFGGWRSFADIGKKIFLNKDEAELYLKLYTI